MKAKTPRQFEKEAERALAVEFKKQGLVYGFKTLSSGFLYHKAGEFFFSAIYDAKMSDTGEMNIELTCYAKPYAYDDVFWDITDTQECKSNGDSLRANGAFTCRSYNFGKISLPYADAESGAHAASQAYIKQCDEFL